MAKSKVKKIIKFLADNLKAGRLNVSKIILFGSQAAGRALPDSDIDIVIISEDFRGKNIFDRVELIKDAEIMTIRKFMVPIDIILMTPEEFTSETSLVADYARDGEILFAA